MRRRWLLLLTVPVLALTGAALALALGGALPGRGAAPAGQPYIPATPQEAQAVAVALRVARARGEPSPTVVAVRGVDPFWEVELEGRFVLNRGPPTSVPRRPPQYRRLVVAVNTASARVDLVTASDSIPYPWWVTVQDWALEAWRRWGAAP